MTLRWLFINALTQTWLTYNLHWPTSLNEIFVLFCYHQRALEETSKAQILSLEVRIIPSIFACWSYNTIYISFFSIQNHIFWTYSTDLYLFQNSPKTRRASCATSHQRQQSPSKINAVPNSVTGSSNNQSPSFTFSKVKSCFSLNLTNSFKKNENFLFLFFKHARTTYL